jgi:hypothetical protein
MKTLTTLAMALAVFAVGASNADAHMRKKKNGTYSHSAKRVKPQVRGYYFRGGGYSNGYELPSMLSKEGPYGYYPYYDDRNFWERVQSDPGSTRPGVSAF